MTGLPNGWSHSTIGQIAHISSGFGFPKHLQGKTHGRFAFAKVADISAAVRNNSSLLTRADNYVDDDDLAILRARPIPSGSTVFAKIGEALKLNRRALTTVDVVLDNNCMALTPKNDVEPRFLFEFMRTVDLAPLSVATTVPSIRRGDVEAITLALPPAAEQRRIVAKLDSLSTRYCRARKELDRITTLAERYKQSILNNTFGKAVQPIPLSDVCEITSGFAFSSFDFSDHGDIPVIRIGDLIDGVVKFTSSTKYLSQKFADEYARFVVTQGDILVALSGATTGKSAVYHHTAPALLNQRIARLRIRHEKHLGHRYVQSFIKWLEAKILDTAYGAAQPNLSPKLLADFQINWPSKTDRSIASRRLENSFRQMDKISVEHERASRLLAKLDEAILAKAFRGELVPQDPNDEPAAKLLERIRADRSERPQRKGRGERRKPVGALANTRQ